MRLAAVVLDEGGVAAVLVGVVLGAHVAAAAPVLVADAEVRHLPRLARGRSGAAGWPSASRRRRSCTRPTPSSPAACRCRRCRGCTARRRAARTRSRNSCVPKWLFSTTPPQCVLIIVGRFSRGPMPSLPVVLVGEAAARPAEDGDVELLQRRDDVVADAARVGDRRVLADPDALVDAAAEVLGEVAVDVPVDDRPGWSARRTAAAIAPAAAACGWALASWGERRRAPRIVTRRVSWSA